LTERFPTEAVEGAMAEASARSVKPDADAIRQARRERGWSAEELAAAAGVSKRTIEKIEKGNDLYPATLKLIADALGMKYRDLLASPEAEPPPRAKPGIKLRLELDLPYEELDQSAQLLSFVKELMKLVAAKGEAEVAQVLEGSVIVELELGEEDARALTAYWQSHKDESGAVVVDGIRTRVLGNILTTPAKTGLSRFMRWAKRLVWTLHAVSLLCSLTGFTPLKSVTLLTLGIGSSITATGLAWWAKLPVLLRIAVPAVTVAANLGLYALSPRFPRGDVVDGGLRPSDPTTHMPIYVWSEARLAKGMQEYGLAIDGVPVRVEGGGWDAYVKPGLRRITATVSGVPIVDEEVLIRNPANSQGILKDDPPPQWIVASDISQSPKGLPWVGAIWLDYGTQPTDEDILATKLEVSGVKEIWRGGRETELGSLGSLWSAVSPYRFRAARIDMPDYILWYSDVSVGITVSYNQKVVFKQKVFVPAKWSKKEGALIIPVRNWKD
jgi:transcriptional regulator with XRE-family HTH domain